MKKISQQDIDYILDSIDIVELVSEYIKLDKRGKNYLGLCPFHNEKTPSFTVSPDKKIAYCFGCGGGGNIFKFLSQIENITYNQAIIKLGNRLGLELDDTTSKKENFNLNNRLDVMYYANSLIADYYNYILLNTKEAEPALNYLISRGINKDSIKYFNIGYAPTNSKLAIDFFKANNISLEYAKDAGIIGLSSENEDYYDVFKDRIMFPIKDDKDKVVAFSGRTMSNDKNIAKYYNTHETDIFEKRKVLYNFSNARQHINKEKNIILCEGYMDVIKAHQSGVKNIVALMGTNIDNDKLDELLKISSKITLALDNDSAGEEATVNIGNKLIKKTDNISKLIFTGEKDIDEFINGCLKKDAEFDFYNYSNKNKKHFLEFKIDYYLNLSVGNIEQKINYKNEILEDLTYIEDKSLKDLLLSYLAEKFIIDKKILITELNSLRVKHRSKNNKSMPLFKGNLYSSIKYDKNLCRMFKYLFLDRAILLEVYEELSSCKFQDKLFDDLLNSLVIYYNNYPKFEIHRFINNISDVELINLATYIDSQDFLIEDTPNVDVVRDYILYFNNEFDLQQNVFEIKNNLKNAILVSDYETQLTLLEQLKKYKK
ncbi:DNA primase [Gemella sp. GH3]|uniref:DNA primase n=1 Tax=unclassified Gemella TaxID=2624949 RepID=UPI0015D03555|nr:MULTISPECIES: DNA primase [unclassified Gemella]MBF0713263.1 DNA primase [Gemella sp. GH3.1]NYS50215.1 DNA primase [Gemella sp. GH3]